MKEQRHLFLAISLRLVLLFILLLVTFINLPRLMDYGRRVLWGVRSGVTLEGISMERYHREEVVETINALAQEEIQWPRDASLDQESGEIEEEVPGRVVALEETLREVMEAEEGESLKLVIRSIPPYITAQQLRGLTAVWGSYATPLGAGNGGRVTNIRLSTRALNNYLLLPGETLSFNQVVGPPTAERGYRQAPIIIQGQVVPGYGGGICQTATTLYNTALAAGLEIVERHRHTMPVDYVPAGMDATISYNSLDLKFKNNTETPLIINGGVGYQIYFSILGPEVED